jgi:hypothetical protein
VGSRVAFCTSLREKTSEVGSTQEFSILSGSFDRSISFCKGDRSAAANESNSMTYSLLASLFSLTAQSVFLVDETTLPAPTRSLYDAIELSQFAGTERSHVQYCSLIFSSL